MVNKLRIEQSADRAADGLNFAGVIGVVITVAAFAAVVSYSHIYHLALRYGQTALEARLMPLSIDGEILAVSLMMLNCSRRGRDVPLGVRAMLWAGVAVTLVANAADGAAHGAGGMAVSIVSGVSFVAVVEGLMWYIRDRRRVREAASLLVTPTAERIAQDAQEAAEQALEATMAAGNALSQRQMIARFSITRDEEIALRVKVRQKLGLDSEVRKPELEHANGDAPDGT